MLPCPLSSGQKAGFPRIPPSPAPGLLSFVDLMTLSSLPVIAPGKKFTHPRPLGSADALLLARFAQAQRDAGRIAAVFTAEPGDT